MILKNYLNFQYKNDTACNTQYDTRYYYATIKEKRFSNEKEFRYFKNTGVVSVNGGPNKYGQKKRMNSWIHFFRYRFWFKIFEAYLIFSFF